MSIEKITSKIISDAEVAAKERLEEAKTTSEAIVKEASKKADQILENAKKRGNNDRQSVISRRRSVASIEGKKIILEKKQAIISECFEEAIHRIVSMDKEKYIEFLTEIVKNTGYNEGELILNQQERDIIGLILVAKLSSSIDNCYITLSEETRNIRGGFLLKKDQVYVNGTVEAIVKNLRESLAGEVAKILFN